MLSIPSGVSASLDHAWPGPHLRNSHGTTPVPVEPEERHAVWSAIACGVGLIGAAVPLSRRARSGKKLELVRSLRRQCQLARGAPPGVKAARTFSLLTRPAENDDEFAEFTERSEAEKQIRAFSSLLEETPAICIEEDGEEVCYIVDPEKQEDDDLRRYLDEAKEEGKQLRETVEWRELHGEARSADLAKAEQVTETRQEQFEDDGTVDSLLVAFMRDVRIRAQAPEREVPAGVNSKVIHLLRHGQGFHNMLDHQDGMEGIVEQPPLPQRVTADGCVWLVAKAFDKLFTEVLGPRIVVGVVTSGVTDFVISYSADFGRTWKEMQPMQNPTASKKHRHIFSKVKCTHLRMRSLTSDFLENATLEILTPTIARPELLDPSLTAQGRNEALTAHKYALVNNLKPELVVVSPVTRATQTAMIVFQHLLDDTGKPNRNVRFVAHEGVHERGGENTCDRRRPLSDLKRDFPYVDYSEIESEEDPTWSALRETQSSMINRAYNFLLWLRDRPEKEIAIAAHCGINFTMLNAVVDCSMDPHLSAWFCTAEMRTIRLLFEEPRRAEAKFVDSKNRILGLGDGLACLYPNVIQLEPDRPGDEDVIVLRRDFSEHVAAGKVSVICGAGAGHEPSYTGFVGEGLLTVGVTGGLFASPSPHTLFRAIMASASEAGCVLIMKNYPGVTFNSGVAAERANSLGVKVEVVLVSDDMGTVTSVATKDARGSAGALLVMKAATACAERGGSLEEVVGAARGVAEKVRSMAMALRWSNHVEPSLEIGVGIHGEVGSSKLESLNQLPGSDRNRFASATIQYLLERLSGSVWLQKGQGVVAMLNNFGGTSSLEMAVLCNALRAQLETRGIALRGLIQGTLMSCQDMRGVSLSLLPLDGSLMPATTHDIFDLLAAPVAGMTAWPGMIEKPRPAWLSPASLEKLKPKPTPKAVRVPERGSYAWLLREAIRAACQALSSATTVNALNQMDGGCGDGAPDIGTGNTHRDMTLAILSRIDEVPCEDAADALLFLADEAEANWRGIVSGIYMLALTAAGQRLRELDMSQPGLDGWTQAARAALLSVQRYGGAQEGDRTLVDAWSPAVHALEKHESLGGDEALQKAVKAAKKGARATQQMLAKKGRAQYAPANVQVRWQDPGAVGVAKWMEAVEKSLKANHAENLPVSAPAKAVSQLG